MHKKVCILTPAFNAGRYLGKAIESAQAQTMRDWVMVIVNDGSKDDTLDVANAYAAKDERIRVFTQKNSGISATRNVALSRVPDDCEYVFNLDADDVLEPTALEELVSYLEAHPKAGAVFCGATIIDGSGTPQGRRKTHRFRTVLGVPVPLRRDGTVPFFNFFCGYGVGPFALLRKRAMSQAGEYKVSLFSCEDVDMFVRIGLQWEIHQMSRPLYLYRWHGTNTSSYNDQNQSAMDVFLAQWENWAEGTAAQNKLVAEARRFRRDWHPIIMRGKFGAAALRNAVKAREVTGTANAVGRFLGVGLSAATQLVRSSLGLNGTPDKPLAGV
jgi:glycosyltransferase involved in cell wall biosynthesis